CQAKRSRRSKNRVRSSGNSSASAATLRLKGPTPTPTRSSSSIMFILRFTTRVGERVDQRRPEHGQRPQLAAAMVDPQARAVETDPGHGRPKQIEPGEALAQLRVPILVAKQALAQQRQELALGQPEVALDHRRDEA